MSPVLVKICFNQLFSKLMSKHMHQDYQMWHINCTHLYTCTYIYMEKKTSFITKVVLISLLYFVMETEIIHYFILDLLNLALLTILDSSINRWWVFYRQNAHLVFTCTCKMSIYIAMKFYFLTVGLATDKNYKSLHCSFKILMRTLQSFFIFSYTCSLTTQILYKTL